MFRTHLRWLIRWAASCLVGGGVVLPGLSQPLPPVPDSLRAAYRAVPRPDAARQAVLLRIATAYIEPLDSAGVLAYGRAAEQLARQLGDSAGVGQAVDVQGHYYQQISNQTLAQPLLERAERLLTEAPPRARATSYYHLGWLYDELNQGRRALSYYRRAYALAVQIGDDDLQASVLNSWSSVYMYRRQYDSAQYYMLRALRLQHRLGQLEGEAVSLNNLASILKMAGRHRAALPYARQAASLQQTRGDDIALATTYNTLGDLTYSLDSLDAARRYFRLALTLGRRHHGEGALSMTYIGLADVFTKTGPLDSAEYYHLRAIRQAQQTNNVVNLPTLMSSLVRFYAERAHRLPEAAAWAARLQALPATEGEQPSLALEARAVVAEARHDYARALELHKQLDAIRAKTLARNNERLTQELRIGFDTERAEQLARISQLQATEQAGRARFYGLVAGGLLLVVVGGGALIGLLVRSRRRLRVSEAAARLANRTKDQLMAIIGHDLRGPVANFQQAMPLVKFYATHPNPAELNALADELNARAQQFGSLLDNLLHWSRTQSNEVRNQPEAVGVAEALGAATTLYRPLAAAKGVTVQVEAAPDLPPAWVDPKLLATVLRNLISNAVKFTAAGGTVTAGATRTADGRLRFEVRDTGVGMTPAQLATVFDAGADRSTRGTAGEGGTGLGLLICERFVALLGGTLQVSSAPGQGTAFGFTLAARQPAE